MKPKIRTGIAAAIGMLLLILDTKTALYGANDGIRLCIATVIPTLFPFIFISNLLTATLTGTNLKILRIFGRFMRMPYGTESIFLIGALGGYPTGAQAIVTTYENGQITKAEARRLLGFCSNAGPSFLFGITATQFAEQLTPWILWGIHLLSAILTGCFLPGYSYSDVRLPAGKSTTAVESLRKSIGATSQICGWIIIFRVGLAFANRWFVWLLSIENQIIFNGTFELSIGCTSLSKIEIPGLRFIVAAAFLSFGGFCVMLQTASSVGTLGMGMYLPGKIMQCCISIFLAAILQELMFAPEQQFNVHYLLYLICPLIIALISYIIRKNKKISSNPQLVVV